MNTKYRGTPLMSFLFKMRNNSTSINDVFFLPALGVVGVSGASPPIFLFSNSSWYLIWNNIMHEDKDQTRMSFFLWSLRAVFHPPGGSSVLCGLAVCAERWGGLMFQQSRLRKLPDAERKWHLRSRKYGELRAAQLAHQTPGEGRNSNNVSKKQS